MWPSDFSYDEFLLPETDGYEQFDLERLVPQNNGIDGQLDWSRAGKNRFVPFDTEINQKNLRSYIARHPDLLREFLEEKPSLFGGIKMPLSSFDGYDRIISEVERTNIPEISGGIDFSQFGLTEEQERQLRRLLDFSLMQAGIAGVDSTNCGTCAGVGQGPTGPVVVPKLATVVGTPMIEDYRMFVKDARVEDAQVTSRGGDSLRRIAIIKLAVDRWVDQSGSDRFAPRYSFVEDGSDGIWTWTSISVVVDASVVDRNDTREWAGFQVTLRERPKKLGSNEAFETVVVVDSFVRRGRGFTLQQAASALDEDFKRMLNDISSSNRIEQRIADSLVGFISTM